MRSLLWLLVIFVCAGRPSWLNAQQQQAARSARSVAPVDLTGVWVSVITEDWRWRMVTPPKGDYPGVPLNAAGEKLANQWDPAKDVAGGEQCRAYGAAGVMRLPTRLRISWENDSTLKIETDAGTQVRRFTFAGPAARGPADDASRGPASATSRGPAGAADEATWQGVSLARWETMNEGQGQAPGGGGQQGVPAQGPALSGSLAVDTTRLRPGYLRRNGVPYSGDARLTEFFDRTAEPDGDSWLIVTSIVDDPTYLAQPFMLTTHFKRERDASKWNPRPCEVTMPVGPAASPR
jgi:hypothetical protein